MLVIYAQLDDPHAGLAHRAGLQSCLNRVYFTILNVCPPANAAPSIEEGSVKWPVDGDPVPGAGRWTLLSLEPSQYRGMLSSGSPLVLAGCGGLSSYLEASELQGCANSGKLCKTGSSILAGYGLRLFEMDKSVLPGVGIGTSFTLSMPWERHCDVVVGCSGWLRCWCWLSWYCGL